MVELPFSSRAIPTLLIPCFFLVFGNFRNAEARNRHYKWELMNEYRSPDCFKKLVITINGITPGPTIQAQEGDTVVVQVNNTLITENLSIHWHEIRQVWLHLLPRIFFQNAKIESRLNLAMSLNIYVPRDERSGHLKLSDFLANALKSILQVIKPELESLFDSTPDEFNSFKDVFKLYEGGIKVPEGILKNVRHKIPAELLKEILRTDGERFLKFPVPQAIKEDKSAWRIDEEFAREMLAGVNPVIIRCLQCYFCSLHIRVLV